MLKCSAGVQVMAALEEACQAQRMTPEDIRDMLRSAGHYTSAVLGHIMAKTGCNDEQKIRLVSDVPRVSPGCVELTRCPASSKCPARF